MVPHRGVRSYARLAVDLTWVALTAFMAVLIRDNFIPYAPRLQAIVPYALVSVVGGAIVFTIARLNRTLWRYTSLADVLRITAAVTIVLLLALFASFHVNRLENIARSTPVIQWLLLVAAMVGTRIAVRLLGERTGRRRSQSVPALTPKAHVLIVGVSDVTELYLRSVAEFAPNDISIVGILSRERELHGRFMRMHKIFGPPEKVQEVLAQLNVHGVAVDRIVVMQPLKKLSLDARKALLEVERSSAIRVDWLVESLGLGGGGTSSAQDVQKADTGEKQSFSVVEENEHLSPRKYRWKRSIDAAAGICLALAVGPVMALVALLVAIDVGLPLVFWQQRPGRYGHPFKLYKFRTMRSAHDPEGNRIPDELRTSSIGHFLRRSCLDELPQLYNILVGEMSFVGPRPLLPIDQPREHTARLLVRPGLTGWAQVNGGRDISPDDKAALDVWYIINASLWLDIKILLHTLRIVVSGGQLDGSAPQAPHRGVEGTRIRAAVECEPTVLTDLGRLSARGVHETP